MRRGYGKKHTARPLIKRLRRQRVVVSNLVLSYLWATLSGRFSLAIIGRAPGEIVLWRRDADFDHSPKTRYGEFFCWF